MSIEATLERIADALETLVARAAVPAATGEVKPVAKRTPKAAPVEEPAPTVAEVQADGDRGPSTTVAIYDRDAVKALAMKYAGVAGPSLLAELFSKHGGEGKFNQVPEANIHLLGVEIADILSQAE